MEIFRSLEEIRSKLDNLNNSYNSQLDKLRKLNTEGVTVNAKFAYVNGNRHLIYTISIYGEVRTPRSVDGWTGNLFMSVAKSDDSMPYKIINFKLETEQTVRTPYYTMLGFITHDIMYLNEGGKWQ